jgi:hypothetical protein
MARANSVALAVLLALHGCSRSASSLIPTDAGAEEPKKPTPPALASASTVATGPHQASPAPLPVGFVRRATFVVKREVDGIDGLVEFLEDERIRLEQLPRDGNVLGGDPCKPVLEEPVPVFCKAIKGGLRPARLRLVSADGNQLSTLEVARPLAAVEAVALRAGVTNIQVTVDFSAGFGSYSGPVTKFAELKNGTLGWLGALDAATGRMADIVVMSSLKTAWKLTPAVAGGREILEVACRPNFEASKSDAGMEFSVRLTRYAIEAGEWHKYVRVEKGFWEDDDKFPARSQFP